MDVLPGHTQLSVIEKRQMRAIIRKRVYNEALSSSEKSFLSILQKRFDSVQAFGRAAQPSALEPAARDVGTITGEEADDTCIEDEGQLWDCDSFADPSTADTQLETQNAFESDPRLLSIFPN